MTPVASAHTAGHYDIRTGWVLPERGPRTAERARKLAPDYLIADYPRIPRRDADIWRGPWQWMVYVIDDLAAAMSCVERGIHLAETDVIGDMVTSAVQRA